MPIFQDKRVGEVLLRHEAAGKIVAAICAAPIALVAHGVAKQGTFTAYPAVKVPQIIRNEWRKTLGERNMF